MIYWTISPSPPHMNPITGPNMYPIAQLARKDTEILSAGVTLIDTKTAKTVRSATRRAAATIDLRHLNSFAENAKFFNKIDIKITSFAVVFALHKRLLTSICSSGMRIMYRKKSFRPYGNSLSIWHLTHIFLLCLYN